MENAHLRLGQLEFRQSTDKISTTLRVHCDCYMGEEEQGLLLSIFGGDTEIAAISAAVAGNSAFSLKFPGEDGETSLCVRMGENAANMRGTILIPGMSHPVRHLVVVSQALRQNGIDGSTYLLNYSPRRGVGLDGLSNGVAGATGVGLLGHRPTGLAAPDHSADRLRLQSVQHPGDTRRAAQHSQPRRPEHEPSFP